MTTTAYQDAFQEQDVDGLEWVEEEEEAQELDGDDRDISLLAEDQYFRQVRWSEPLPREEEATLFRRVQCGRLEQGNPRPNQWVLSLAKHARDRLVEGFQPLVIHIAQRYVRLGRNLDVMDAIQEGNTGLLKAIELHEPEQGGFTGLASRCIAFAISEALWHQGNAVHFSDDVRDGIRKLRRAERRLQDVLGERPTVQQLAVEMEVREEVVRELQGWWLLREIPSLQSLFSFEEGDTEEWNRLLPLWGAEVLLSAPGQALEQVLEGLNEYQRRVMQMLYGLGDSPCYTYWEVARAFGVTAGAISACERDALRRLRRLLAPEGHMQHPGGVQESEFYTSAQAVAVLGIKPKRFEAWVARGKVWQYPIEVVGGHQDSRVKYCYGKTEIDALAEQKRGIERTRLLPGADRPVAARENEVA